MMQNDSDANALPVAVVGVGRMGKHHARTYHQMPEARLVAVVDAGEDRRETIADEYGCDAFADIDAMLAVHPRIRAVSIAVPTVYHLDAARPLLERGIACLVEKPLAQDTATARQLVDLAEQTGSLLQVGHTERFNPAVMAVARLGLTPRFIEVNRISPMTFRSLDVGVVMDMMIHDLDIVLTLADSPVVQVDATGVAVLGKHEDVANARITFKSGCVANITASRLALKTDRRMRLFNESAYVSLDYQRKSGVIIQMADNAQALAQVRAQLEAGVDLSELDYSELISVQELTMQGDAAGSDPLTNELSSFLTSVRQGGPAQVTAEEGLAAVSVAEQVVAAIAEHQWEGLPQPPRPRV